MPRTKSKHWVRREKLREKGQFWTPPWVAKAMVCYVRADGGVVFDPAFGAGAFALAGRELAKERGLKIRFAGSELHSDALEQARAAGVPAADLRRVALVDFLSLTSLPAGANVVANPPYMRHHRLDAALKARLQQIAERNLGRNLDGRTGIHVFFLIHALSMLRPGGALAFILPSDVCEGVFARTLWDWIARRFRIEGVVTFAPEATPFPRVDTNPVVLLIKNLPPQSRFMWARIGESGGNGLVRWVEAGMPESSRPGLVAESREVEAGVQAGMSRRLQLLEEPTFRLGDFVRVMRGIATGSNEFFCMTSERARGLGIPENFMVRVVGRTRDIPGGELTLSDLDALDHAGRETYLFAPDGRPLENFPPAVRQYLGVGGRLGLPDRALIAQRRPWYKMEQRIPPPFLFAYLGRRNTRFIVNRAGARPLTGFLCVYPLVELPVVRDRVEALLRSPSLLDGLELVAKSYGAGALKVEPRALERLPVPDKLAKRLGLRAIQAMIVESRERQQMMAL